MAAERWPTDREIWEHISQSAGLAGLAGLAALDADSAERGAPSPSSEPEDATAECLLLAGYGSKREARTSRSRSRSWCVFGAAGVLAGVSLLLAAAWHCGVLPGLYGRAKQAQKAGVCHDARPGDSCFGNVTWARTVGIFEHPEWYAGLARDSSFSAFQQRLAETPAAFGNCRRPCAPPTSGPASGHEPDQAPAGVAAAAASAPPPTSAPAEEQEEVDREAGLRMTSEGGTCYVPFDAAMAASARCFCQLAGNTGCAGGSCTCAQGCEGSWRHETSASFPNLKAPTGCPAGGEVAVLTIPKSFFSDIAALSKQCPAGMLFLVKQLLMDGYRSYQEQVAPGPVMQCIHAPGHTSIPWLHVHTFCAGGSVDGMPLSPPQGNGIAYCDTLRSAAEAEPLARRIAQWAAQLPGTGAGR